jgi:Xaa-Pro aminopeptidase
MKKKGKTGKKVEEKEASSDDPIIGDPGVQNGVISAVYNVSPVALAKSVKNDAEIEGMKSSHLRYCIEGALNQCCFLFSKFPE